MLLKQLKPSSISGDNDYVKTVFSIGDTTEAWVQIKALKSYGITAKFYQNGTNELLKQNLDQGIPVPCGILHKGAAHAPSGGGHWIIVIGYQDDASYPGGGYWIVNDPWGEINHATGHYDTYNGENVKYSYALMDARWTVDHQSDGWCILASAMTLRLSLLLWKFVTLLSARNNWHTSGIAAKVKLKLGGCGT